MISASKTTYSHYKLKILTPKVMKNIKNFRKKFCEFPPRFLCFFKVKSHEVRTNSLSLESQSKALKTFIFKSNLSRMEGESEKCQKIVRYYLTRPTVNFINILRARFSYEHRFGSFCYVHMYVVKAAKTTLVQKIRT